MTQQKADRLSEQIDRGVRSAVAAALEEHHKMGRTVVIECAGKIVHLSPEEILTSYSTANPTVNQKENGHVD